MEGKPLLERWLTVTVPEGEVRREEECFLIETLVSQVPRDEIWPVLKFFDKNRGERARSLHRK
jgi:hypothetical protein